jgi:outer membrane biosynthesis protein TonB
MSVDANGHVTDSKLILEDPAGFNFGAAALQQFRSAKFIPGFRDGRAVACTFTLTTYFRVYRYFRGY